MERLRLRVGGVSLLAALLVASVAPSTVLRASTAEGGLSEFLVVLKHDPDPGAGDDHRVAGSSFSSAQDAPAVGPSPAPRNANAPSKSSDRPPEIGPAATALAALDETLAVLRAEGAVADVEAFPRLGVIAVVGDAKAREAIAGRTDVTAVAPNERRQLVAVSNTLHPSGTGGPATANGWNEAGPTGSSEPGTATGWNVGAVGAEAAWGEIGASGQGVTIAAIDSGADWTHWALRGSYRGRDGHHNYNWMDFARPDRPSDRPIDELGHGTQVLSIAVGGSREGGGGATRADALGVAPGAEWIAVRTFDRHGFSTDRQLLRAAEWLLAPTKLDGSEPQARMAPDVVNCSWVLENGSDPLYDAVIRAWRDAGILPVFAAGNSDDGTRSAGGVLAPAGNPGVLAVGATNRDGAVWPLSKGGPSFGGDTKPDLVAPGVGVPTALIGGDTVYGTGTSMAAPHVSGAAAIMLSANPGLGVDDLARGLRDAADDIAPPGPDNGSGWGSLDARAAAEWALLAGRVAGTVSDENGDPIEGAAVSIEPHSGAGAAQAEEGRWHSPPDGGAALPADALALGAGLAPVAAASPDGHELSTLFSLVTGGDGTYSAAVSPGAWRVSAIDAEHVSGSSESRVLSELSTITDVRLSSAPMGRVTGRVTGAFDQAVEGATVELAGDVAGSGRALGVSGPDGMYDVRVKTGDQKLAFRADRLRVVTAEVRVQAVTETALDVRMTSVPRALVVDADAYTGERIHRYALEALRSRGIGADVWAVADPSSDLPGAADLAAYDVIIWLHVFGSPGRLDAYRRDSATEALLAGYVADGGRLIVSGQDIARHDSGDDPLESGLAPELVSSTFGARYLADDSGQSTVLGDLWLDGLTLRLDEPGGRDMGPRLAPDVIEPSGSCAPGACQPPLRYAGGRAAAMAVDGPGGRRVYLAFGPECVGDRAALGELYDRLLGWLEAPRLSLAAEPHVVAMGDVARLQAEVAAGRDAARCELEVAVGTDWAIETGSSGISVVDDNLASWSGDVAAGERLSLDIAARLTGPAAGGEPQVVTATLRSRGSVTVVTDTLQAMAPDLSPSSARANPGRIASDGAVEYSLLLENAGPAASVGARSRILLPVGATAITETLTATEGEVLWEPGGTVAQWRGDLAAGAQAKVR
ncbi:MAG: S8 family serine peptidase, partial [Anaerolineae bacterium]